MTQLVITKEYIDSLSLEQALVIFSDSHSAFNQSASSVSYVLRNTAIPNMQTRAEAEEFLNKLSVAEKVFILLHRDAGEDKFSTLKAYIRENTTVALLQMQTRTTEQDVELRQLESQQELLDAQGVNTSTNQDSSKSRGIISFLIGIIFGFLLFWFIFKEIIPLLLNP